MKYGLIGEKLTHSLSKKIYGMCGLDYSLVELNKEDIKEFLDAETLTSFNVTIPYKQTIMPYLDYIDSEAKDIGAVNTVKNDNGKLSGYNTDIFGMRLALKKANISVKDSNVLILGSGGTSNTAYYLAKTGGAKTITKVSRTGEINYDNCYNLKDTNVIINATPVGMYPNNYMQSVDLARFPNLSGVFDAVYNPLNTNLILQAKQLNINASGGLYMLVGQAIKSMSIFNNEPVDEDKINEIYSKLLLEFSNLVLIGMPGSGKSVIGEEVAKQLNKQFVDVDKMFEQVYHLTPADEIINNGEKSFRDKETAIIRQIKEGNLVIATGGGSVLKKENINYLKQNGILVYIDRDINKLSKSGRPLSLQVGLQQLYSVRKPLYEGYCDYKVVNNNLEETIREVIKGYEKNIGN